MLDYLQKYSQLPEALRQKFSSPQVVTAIKSLEEAYGVKLGTFVIRVLVNDVGLDQGASFLINNFNLSADQANALMLELKAKVFAPNLTTASAEPVAPTPTTATVKTVSSEILPTDNLEQQLEKVIKSVNVEFASRDLAERFRKIVYTHLKGIRDKINTKEALIKPVENGGLGFDVNSAENILRLMSSEEPNGAIKRPLSWSDETAAIARDVEYDLASAIKAKREAGLIPPVEDMAEEKLLEPPTPSIVGSLDQLKPEMPPATATAKSPEVVGSSLENLRRTESGKIKMDDVIGSPRVFTPVDEIRYMTVKNFRNLSPDPVRAIEIIKKKIEALAAESYTAKIAGLQGWKLSPVNRMYVEAYQEAINEGKSVSATLNKKKKLNPEFITEAEFEAILTLNQDMKQLFH